MKINRRKFMEWIGMAGGSAVGTQWLAGKTALDETAFARGGAKPAGVFGMGAADQSSAQTSGTRWERIAAMKRQQTKDVTWLTHEPIEFVLRRGDHGDDEAAHYARMIDPDNIKRMADAGVTYGRIFFYKGFGLAYERPHMDQAKQAADLMHKLGMKVSLYIGGTMFIETFYRETPEAVNWEQRDQWNQPVPYGIQTFRHFACPNEPKYRDYLKKILLIGIRDLGADELAFDNTNLQAEPQSCRCARCIAAFSEYLRARYGSREAAKRRFGLADVGWIRINEWNSFTQPDSITLLDDPVLQEWTRFRCETMAKYTGDLYDYVKSVNPKTGVLLNIKGVYSFNRYWSAAVYHPLFANHIDLMAFDTIGYDEHIDARTGALISQIRSYKMARRIGTSCEDSFGDDVRAAVHMAFGYQKPGAEAAPVGYGAFNVFTPMVEFFREYNDRYYTETENVADVAVLRNWPSMAYSVSATYVPATLMEQVLIQYKVPFDLLCDEELESANRSGRMGRYAAVILAGQECVSDAQQEMLLEYVRGGGTLVVTGNTGEFNQRREQRAANQLMPARSEGKGRIVYIPNIIPADPSLAVEILDFHDPHTGMTPPKGINMVPAQWVLPTNHAEIYATIVDAMPEGLSITSEAPLTTVMELLTRAKTRETIAHFVNFDKQIGVGTFAVTLRKQAAGEVKSVTWLSPDTDQAADLKFSDVGGEIKFMVPGFRTYGMVVVAQ